MAVSVSGGVERADMVTMRGEGVGGVATVTTESAASQGLAHPGQCRHPNGTGAGTGTPTGTPNGEAAQWKPAGQEASKMAKIREVVDSAAR